MISCAFPPIGGPGVQRSAKFAKYLPRFGWLPTVWATDHLPGLPEDPSLLADLPPEVAIHRLPCRGRHSVRRHLAALARGRSLTARWARAAEWRLAGRSAQATTVDEYAPWTRASMSPLCRLTEQGIAAVYSTFSPPANHLLALALKRRYRLPWIADFRDLWTDDPRYHVESSKCRTAHRRAEQEILEAADVVIGVTESQAEILSRHVPAQRSKFVAITNGFDPDDFNRLDEPPREDHRFILAHVGRLDHWRTGDGFFAGLCKLVDRLDKDHARVTLRVVGHATPDTLSMLRRTGINHTFRGYVPHAEAIREMKSADALLLLVGHSHPCDETILTAKIFEYLAAERPILFVGPPQSEPARLIRKCGAGLSVTPDAEAIAGALDELYGAWRRGRLMSGCDASRRSAYSRVETTGRLAALLDELVHSGTGAQGPATRPAAARAS